MPLQNVGKQRVRKRWKTGIGDPSRNSLWLLPSGPDQVGEELVHHQPSAETYRILRSKMQVFRARISIWRMQLQKEADFDSELED